MPWVEAHRRRVPGRLFGRTTVRRHYRLPAGLSIIPIVVIAAVIIILLALIF